jgi:hypothetical protein
MCRAAGQPAGQPVGDLHQQIACARPHQDGAENDEDQHVAGYHLDRLAEHAAGLGPEIEHHCPQVLRDRRFRARQDAGPFRQPAAGEEIDDPEDRETDDEAAIHPVGEIECERHGQHKGDVIQARDRWHHACIGDKDLGDPGGENRDRKRRHPPVDEPQAGVLVQGERRDHEGKGDRQTDDQSGRQQEALLETAVCRAKPVLPQHQPLVAP